MHRPERRGRRADDQQPKVFVTGRVTTPGAHPLVGPLTVLQAIALAGGLTEYADAKNITMLRDRRRPVADVQVQLQGRREGQETGAEHPAAARRHRRRSLTQETRCDSPPSALRRCSCWGSFVLQQRKPLLRRSGRVVGCSGRIGLVTRAATACRPRSRWAVDTIRASIPSTARACRAGRDLRRRPRNGRRLDALPQRHDQAFVEANGLGYVQSASVSPSALVGGDANLRTTSDFGGRNGMTGGLAVSFQPSMLFNAFGPIGNQLEGGTVPGGSALRASPSSDGEP